MTRIFTLERMHDVSGVSGTGTVATGVEFDDGTVALRWHGAAASTVIHSHISNVQKIHGHDGSTTIVWQPRPLNAKLLAELHGWGFKPTGGRLFIAAGGAMLMWRDEDGSESELAASIFDDAEMGKGNGALTTILRALMHITGASEPRTGMFINWQVGDTVSPMGDDGVAIVRELRGVDDDTQRPKLGVTWLERRDDTALADLPIEDLVDDGNLVCHPGIGIVGD